MATENDPLPRVLAVEDNAETATLLTYALRKEYDLCLVATVDEALDRAQRTTFAVLLLDINLGESRSGTDLLHMLRALPGYAQVPAVALTAYAMPGDRERFLNAGFDAYVSKPFLRRDLLHVLEDLLQGQR